MLFLRELLTAHVFGVVRCGLFVCLFRFLFFALFVFVLYLLCLMLPVSLDCSHTNMIDPNLYMIGH